MNYLIATIIVLSALSFVPQTAIAAEPTCAPIFGGGNKCISPDPTTASKKSSPTPTPLPTKHPIPTPVATKTTKGGQVVHAPTQTKQTPATGPEALALLALPASAAAGVYLRHKSTRK